MGVAEGNAPLSRRAARQGNVPPDRAEAAWWEIYAAEGSDWFWWYGPDFTIDTDFLFDELFRLHLQNVYRILGVEPPAHLDVPICLPEFRSRLYAAAAPADARYFRRDRTLLQLARRG